MCPNCGAYHYEQSTGDPSYMVCRCLECGCEWELERFRREGEDLWRDPRDREDW